MDDIQRKLALIDQQLAGQRNLHEQIVSTSPLAFIAVGLITGILLQNKFELSLGLWLTLLTLFTAGTLVFFALQRLSFNNQLSIINYQFIIAYMALACFVCLGAIRLNSFYQPRSNDIRNLVSDERKLATIHGLIVTEPYINQNQQWKFAKFTYTDPTSSFYLKVKEVKTVAGWAETSGIVRVQVDEPVLDLKAGDYVQAYCWLDRFKAATNPGQFDTAKYLSRKNVFIAASIDSRDGIELVQDFRKGAFTKLKSKLREIATQALLGELDVESQEYALLQALVLGYRTKIDNETYRAFQETGLLHFISLSGMNFGIVIMIIWGLCKTAGLMKRARAVICLLAAGAFLLVVPPNSPAIRAAIMSSVFCISFFFQKKSNPFNTLSLAAVILLLIRPTYLFEPAWQLSFASVAGILLFTVLIENFIHERTIEPLKDTDAQKRSIYIRIISRITSPVIKVFAISLAAWLASAGILLYHFYAIDYLTSIWTVLVSPLIAITSISGYLKMLVSLPLPSAAAKLDIIIVPLSNLLIRLVKLIAGWNISEILIGKVSPTVVILYYAFLLFAFFVHFRRPFVKKLICTVVAVVIIVFLGAAKWHRTYRDNLVLSCLDVSHGQAILAQLPDKANVLFDAGSLHKSDIGRRIVAPFLDYSGISKIDAIIISHNDVDHINGILEIAEHCEVGSIYANDAFLTAVENDPCDTAGTLKTLLNDQNLKIQRLGTELTLGSKAKIKILWPNDDICRNEELSDNDKSVVSLIEFAGRKILLCSDIEKFAQQELLQLFPDLKANIVIAPHHGLGKSSQAKFLESLEPDILIYSCGQSQYERTNPTPHPLTHESKTKSFYTPKDGAITVCIKNDGTIRTDVFAE